MDVDGTHDVTTKMLPPRSARVGRLPEHTNPFTPRHCSKHYHSLLELNSLKQEDGVFFTSVEGEMRSVLEHLLQRS